MLRMFALAPATSYVTLRNYSASLGLKCTIQNGDNTSA